MKATQTQLADEVGVSQPYISQIEKGKMAPDSHIIDRIADALRVPADELYYDHGFVDLEDPTHFAVGSGMILPNPKNPSITPRVLKFLHAFHDFLEDDLVTLDEPRNVKHGDLVMVSVMKPDDPAWVMEPARLGRHVDLGGASGLQRLDREDIEMLSERDVVRAVLDELFRSLRK